MKRNLIIITIVAIIGALAATYYFTINRAIFSKETSLYKAVPISSPVFVEASSVRTIPFDNPLINALSGIESFGAATQKLEKTIDTISATKEIQSSWAKRPVILAFDFVGEDKLQPVLISKIRSSEELKGLELLLEKLMGVSGVTPQERKYSGYKVFSITNSNGYSLHYCAAGGLVIISPESILVDKSLRQLSSENLTDIRNFNRVNKTVTSQSDLSWYINHNRFPELWMHFLNGTTQTQVNEFGETIRHNLRREITGLRNYAGWSELDMTFHDNHIALNGITAADDSLNHFITVFDGQQPENGKADKVLPRNTSFFIGFTFSDRDRFFENLVDYFVHSNTYYEREEILKKIERRLGDDSRNTLRNMLDNEVVAAITGIDEKLTTLFVVSLRSKKESQENFEAMLQNYASSKNVEFSSMYTSIKAGENKTFRVYHFPYPSFPGVWLGESFRFAKASYAAFYDDYLVFASSEKAMQEYLSDMELNYTLEEDRAYASFKRATENKANISTFTNVSRILPLSDRLFNSDLNTAVEANSDILRKFYGLSWQLVCDRDVYFNAINLGLYDRPQSNGRALWKADLGAQVASKPAIVTNHNNPAEKEVIVQDEDNRLHLVAANGTVLWTIPVSSKIISDIHQVDVYRNGNLQYLFNTEDKLYLIDRTGSNVSGFPVVFDSPATNGVNVFDYDNNRKYRYFLAFENHKVLAYDQNGKIVSGWKFGQTKSAVTTPVQHFRVSNRDYIVFKDQEKIYIQDRRGGTRVNVSARFENSQNPLVLNLDGTQKIVATDKNGKVYYLYFDGKFAEKTKGGLSSSHYFTVDDLDGNNTPDFVFVDGNRLEVADENGHKLYDEKMENPITTAPGIYTFSDKQKMVGITDSKENRIYLFDTNGKQYEGFPFNGNSAFSIGALTPGQLCVVSGNNRDELVCYGLK